jgi:hypothetical protein
LSSNPPPITDPNESLGTYSFLPHLRQGIATSITGAASGIRATINVAFDVNGVPVAGGPPVSQSITQDVALYCPGDLLNIKDIAVVRTEPRAWVTNFESNYLAAIDFYPEDYPWLYTPAAPSGLKLQPWLALIVLTEDEFDEGKGVVNVQSAGGDRVTSKPQGYITLKDLSVLPPNADLWAWAHGHFNRSLSPDPTAELVSPDMNAVLPRVASIISANPDDAYSRLMCPRRLNVNTGYHAFLVPSFESGRLAGLSLDPTKAPSATASAWASYPNQAEPSSFPYYYRWYFRTGDRGDFPYLVSLLKPQPVDKTVGRRQFDSTNPGSNIPPITKAGLNGVLLLGGALQVPDADLSQDDLNERQAYENWDQPYPDAFETGLAQFINLPDDYAAKTPADANAATSLGSGVADDPDPLITSPLYGRWHALTQRLLTNRDGTPASNTNNWVHRLNLDPRFRIPANYGVEVVEANAEDYMNYAWEQIGDVLAANQKIRRLHFALAASTRMYQRHLTTVSAVPQRVLSLTAPVANRVLGSSVTISTLRSTSLVPEALTSTVFRRAIRSNGRLMRILPLTATATRFNLIDRVNAGAVTSAPPKTIPSGLPTVNGAAQAAVPSSAPPAVLGWLKQYPWLPYAVLIALLVLAFLFAIAIPVVGIVIAIGLVILGIYLFRLLQKWAAAEAASQALTESGQTASSIPQMPTSSNFVLSTPGSSFRPTLGGADNATAQRFKTALSDSFQLVAAGNQAGFRPAPIALNLTSISATMINAVDPRVTILRRGLTTISLPAWIISQISADFNEVMAYPKIDLPMYKPLTSPNVERFLPNIDKIPENSITLMETNPRFIEAYMVGLNHDFAAKLLWREYPTDQRGSYFRQFWAVDNYIDSEGKSETDNQEQLYDIPEIHRWRPDSGLGQHNNRITSGTAIQSLAVLIVRGELLQKYPNTVIFAQHAIVQNGLRNPDWCTPQEELAPPRTKTRTPLFSANPKDDIFFFGFDLTIDEIKGSGGDPGWYFVLQERPGEARFGLAVSRNGAAQTLDEVTWDDVVPATPVGQSLPASSLANIGLGAPDPAHQTQHNDDKKIATAQVSAARWAYLLFRPPVMVAIHGDQMLAQNRP